MPKHINSIKPISGKSDDLFICAAGVGDISTKVAGNILYDKAYDPNLVFLIDYQEPTPTQPTERGWTWQKWFNEQSYNSKTRIRSHLLHAGIDSNKVGEINFRRGQSLTNTHVFQFLLKEHSLEQRVGNVTIDMTSIPDDDLLSLLYVLDKPDNNVRLLYAEPPAGAIPKGEGILVCSTVPHFAGEHQSGSTSQHVSVLMAGYDASKIYSIDDHMRSAHSIIFFPKPAFHKNWDVHSKRLNDLMASGIYSRKQEDVSELDPQPVKEALEKVYSSYPINEKDPDKKWYMGVGLAGCTKWPVVGAYLFARDKMKKQDYTTGGSFDWSPIAVYYSTPVFEKPLGSQGSKVSELILPKKA